MKTFITHLYKKHENCVRVLDGRSRSPRDEFSRGESKGGATATYNFHRADLDMPVLQ